MSADLTNGLAGARTARGPDVGGSAPVSTSSSGVEPRRPGSFRTPRVPGLYERTLAHGSTVYDARLRLGGNVRRHRVVAQTKTDAISELRNLQTDYARGEAHRSPAAGVTISELASDYVAHLRTRVND